MRHKIRAFEETTYISVGNIRLLTNSEAIPGKETNRHTTVRCVRYIHVGLISSNALHFRSAWLGLNYASEALRATKFPARPWFLASGQRATHIDASKSPALDPRHVGFSVATRSDLKRVTAGGFGFQRDQSRMTSAPLRAFSLLPLSFSSPEQRRTTRKTARSPGDHR